MAAQPDSDKFRQRLLELLEKDPQVRSRVHALVLESEVLKELRALREESDRRFAKMQEESERRFAKMHEESSRRFDQGQEELRALREESERRFAKMHEESSRRFDQGQEELRALREESERRFAKMQEESERRFAKMQEESERRFAKMQEESDRRFKAVMQEIKGLRDDMGRLGQRWGIQTEEAVRAFMQEFVASEFGVEAQRWRRGKVELDIVVRNGLHAVIEVKSAAYEGEVRRFARHVAVYAKAVGVEPERKILVTAHANHRAYRAAAEEGIEIVSG